MKKWMNYVLIAGLSAGTASAAWWPFGSDEKETKETEAPAAPAPEKPGLRHREGAGEKMREQLTPEQKEKMKAKHEQLTKLGEAARKETDPAKKEQLVGQLRIHLTEVADNMQAERKRRQEQAGKEMKNLEKNIGDYEANKAARVEEQIKRILAGEPLMQKHQGKPGEEPHKKGPKAPDAK